MMGQPPAAHCAVPWMIFPFTTMGPPVILPIFIALSAAATVASGLQYIYRGLIWLQERAPSIHPPG